MMKVCLLLALTLVASVSALQDAASGGEPGPEPYSYSYQADSHSASEQRDQQGRVTGFYTLADADGRERKVEYVADENGFRAKVATNEVGTKSESPANVEFVAAEPTPAQYTYVAQAYQAPAQASFSASSQGYQAPLQASYQGSSQAYQTGAPAQYVRQQTYQVGAAPQVNFARSGYTQQQHYAYNPSQAGYYAAGYQAGAPASSYGSSYNTAYGGYGTNAPGYFAPAGGVVTGTSGPASSYYSYRSSTVGAPATNGYSSGYRYRSSSVGVPAGGVTTYSSGVVPVGGVTSYSASGPAGVSTTASRSSSYQGSSNYLVLQKRAAEQEKAASSS